MRSAKHRSLGWLVAGLLCTLAGLGAMTEAFAPALLLFAMGLLLLWVYVSPRLPAITFTYWDVSDVMAFVRLLWKVFSGIMDAIGAVADALMGRAHTPGPPPRAAERPPGIQPLPGRQAPPPPEEQAPADAQTRLPNGGRAYAHAINAARAAGLDVTALALPVDLGFMAFTEGERSICRSIPPSDDAGYLQPFVVLQLASRAAGRVRFEIIDCDGQRLFVHEDQHMLKPGPNLISPGARLRILPSHNMAGPWELRVSADGVPLAVHSFTWRESRATLLRRTLHSDGELHQEARQQLANDSRVQRLTLDDLLAEEGTETERPAERGARRL